MSSDEYQTPSWLINFSRTILGDIFCDPATSLKANNLIQARLFYTKEKSGLEHSWSGNIWLHPPCSKPLCGLFVDKLILEWQQKNIINSMVLVNSSTSSKWFHKLLNFADICLIFDKCIKFLLDGNQIKNNRYSQFLFLLTRNPGIKMDFETLGNQYGKIIELNYRKNG